jgi:hypothetical protein
MSAKDVYIERFTEGILGDNNKIQKALGDLASDFYDASVSLIPVADSCDNTKLANMDTQTFKGRTTAGTGNPEDLTTQQARALLGQGSVEVLTTDRTVVAADSGKKFVMNGVAGAEITLPAVAVSAGFYAKFIVGAAIATTPWTIVAASNVIYGSAVVNGAHVAASAKNTVSFIVATAIPGDLVELECDGTNWYVNGSAVAAGAITFTAP